MSEDTIQRAPVEWRAATVSDVRYADRIIEVIAIPYNEETEVEYRGRMVIESVLPGAFDGIETRPGRVTVNRDHDYQRTVGVPRKFHPSRSEGLVTDVRIAPTPLGDETLELANEGALGASVGMGVRPSDQRWSDGNRRRQIVRAFLDHIALLPNPAYSGAAVLAVRGDQKPSELWQPPATPKLDEVMAYTAQINALLQRNRCL